MRAIRTQPKPGNIGPMVDVLARIFHQDPAYVYATLAVNFPQISDQAKCLNCNASMLQRVYIFDVLDAILLLTMARAVRIKVIHGRPFTLANHINVQDLPTTYAVKSRTTKAAKLGLIAKARRPDGSHHPGHWLITTRGWAALRGEPVPKYVTVYRNHIEERHDEPTTLAEALRTHLDKVQHALAAHRTPKCDYRNQIGDYRPTDWADYGGYHQGALL